MFLRTIRIPIQGLDIDTTASSFNINAYNYGTFNKVTSRLITFDDTAFISSEITMDATIAVWLIAFVCFIGWIFFLLYASIGLAALPIDLFIDYKRRPTLMKPIAYSKMKKQVADRAESLAKLAEELKMNFRKMTSSEKAKSKRDRNKATIKIQQQTLLLERDWEGEYTHIYDSYIIYYM